MQPARDEVVAADEDERTRLARQLVEPAAFVEVADADPHVIEHA